MTTPIDTPPHRDLEERSERLLILIVDAWLSSGFPLRFGKGVWELTEAGFVVDDNDDLTPTDLGILYSRRWLDLEGHQRRTRAILRDLVARGPKPIGELDKPSVWFARRRLLRAGELGWFPSSVGQALNGLPQKIERDPTETRAWHRLLASPTVKYGRSLNPILGAGLAYRADWEPGMPVRLSERGKQLALWQRPGGQLLRLILPAWKAALPEGAVDGFLSRQLAAVVDMLDAWIPGDARRRSEAAIPDDALDRALRLAADGERDELLSLAASVAGDYWAMDALHRRGEAHPQGARLIVDALASASSGDKGADRSALRALEGKRPSGWSPPVYRRRTTTSAPPPAPRRASDRRLAAALGDSDDDERRRADREGLDLDLDSLAVFDKLVELKGDALDGRSRVRVQEVARGLTSAVEKAIAEIHEWRAKVRTQAQIKVLIRDYLYGDETGLPSAYQDDEIEELAEALYQHFYERSVALDDERALEKETRDILDDAVVDELKLRPHTLDSLVDTMNATRSGVVASLTRLLNQGRIWRHADHGKAAVYAHLSVGIGSHRSGRHRVTFPSVEEVHGAPIREDAKRVFAAARALGGRAPRALDMLRPDADGRTIARALLDLTAPRKSTADVHSFLRKRNFDAAAAEIWDAPPTANPDYLRTRVWDHVLREAPVIRVKGPPGKLRVLPAAIRKVDVPWVAVRRVEDGRVSLDRVDVRVVQAHTGGSIWIEPLGEGVLEPDDEVHLWVHSSPEALSELYSVLGDFFDDLKYKPQALADVRTLLFWTGVMLDTPQCNGEAKSAATRAFNQAKLYYDVAREQSESSVWTVGVLRRVAAAASAVTTACGEGKPLPSFDFHEPTWRPSFPEEINTPQLRALYEVLGHNPGLARRVDAAAAGVDEDHLAAAIAPHLAGRGEDVERIVQVLKAVEEMRTLPGLRAIYPTLGWSFQDTRKVQEALEGAPDGWRGNLIKERIVMGSLYEVLADGHAGASRTRRDLEDIARRILAIAKEETDL